MHKKSPNDDLNNNLLKVKNENILCHFKKKKIFLLIQTRIFQGIVEKIKTLSVYHKMDSIKTIYIKIYRTKKGAWLV